MQNRGSQREAKATTSFRMKTCDEWRDQPLFPTLGGKSDRVLSPATNGSPSSQSACKAQARSCAGRAVATVSVSAKLCSRVMFELEKSRDLVGRYINSDREGRLYTEFAVLERAPDEKFQKEMIYVEII